MLQFVAQFVRSGSFFFQLTNETRRQCALFIERTHRAAERQHHFVEGAFQRIEIVELAAGVDQQPVKRFAFVAAMQFAFNRLAFGWVGWSGWRFGFGRRPFVAADLIKVALASAIVPALWGVLRKVRG